MEGLLQCGEVPFALIRDMCKSSMKQTAIAMAFDHVACDGCLA